MIVTIVPIGETPIILVEIYKLKQLRFSNSTLNKHEWQDNNRQFSTIKKDY